MVVVVVVERSFCYLTWPWLLHPNFASLEHRQPHQNPVESGVAVPFGAVLQAMAVAPNEVAGERRRRLEVCDPSQRRRQVQGVGVVREKLLADPISAAAEDADTAPCPTLPSQHPVDLPTGHLEGTHHHSLHHQDTHSHQFAMALHLARNGRILHSLLHPREWALYVSTEERDG